MANNSVIYNLEKQEAIMHIVSFFAEEMGKMCKTNINFYGIHPPFDQIAIPSSTAIETRGKRAHAMLATDLRQKKLTPQQLNTHTVIVDGK